MEASRSAAFSVDSEKWIVQMKWINLEELEMPWGLAPNMHQDAPTYLVSQLRNWKLIKPVQVTLQNKYDIQVSCGRFCSRAFLTFSF